MYQVRRCLLWTFGLSTVVAIMSFFLLNYAFQNFIYNVYIRYFFSIVYMWVPGICALKFLKKEKIKISLFEKPKRWVLQALILPVVFTFLSILIGAVFSPINSGRILPIDTFFYSLTPFYMLNVIGFYCYLLMFSALSALSLSYLCALGEEILWRGYLWEKFKWLGFTKASLSIGIVWGLWHAPIILFLGHNYNDHRLLGVFWMVVFCVLLSPVMIYLKEKGDSIAPAVVFHAMLNAIAPLSFMFYEVAPNPLIVTTLGISGFLALIVLNIALYPRYKKRFSSGHSLKI